MVVPRHLAEETGRKVATKFAKDLPMQDHKAVVSAHLSVSPNFAKGQFGKSFCSKNTNFRREDTKKVDSKVIDLQRRQKKIAAEKDRLKKLREIGNVKIPKEVITNLYRII